MIGLILGHTGQLGEEFARSLAPLGKARVLNRDKWNFENLEETEKIIRLLKPDVILNAIAWTDVDKAEDYEEEANFVNAIIPKNLAIISKRLGIKLVQISTDYVFSGNNSEPWNIDDQVQPINAYGRSKALGEKYILDIYPANTYLFRTAWLYSSHRVNFVKTMLSLALKNEESISVVDDQFGQPTSARDLAAQIIHGLEEGISPGIYHATNSGTATWNEFAKEIFILANQEPTRVLPISSKDLIRRASRPKNSVLSHDCWAGTSLQPMRNWKVALAEQIEEIKSVVIAENR